MIQMENEKEACEIVIDAMREMQKVLHEELAMYQTYENTTAELAKSIDGKKHFIFGDVNTEKIVD